MIILKLTEQGYLKFKVWKSFHLKGATAKDVPKTNKQSLLLIFLGKETNVIVTSDS